jgi:hypothetical protein
MSDGERHMAMLRIGFDEIRRLLIPPEGCQITGVRDDFPFDGLAIRIEGPSLPVTAPGAYPTMLPVSFEYVPPDESEPAGTLGRMRLSIDWEAAS